MDNKPKIIDLHHHVIPREYLESLTKVGVKESLGTSFPEWDVRTTLDRMDRNGIATAFVSISAPGVYFKEIKNSRALSIDLAREMNEVCANLIRDNPGRFGAFAILPLPDVDAALAELRHALDVLELDGVILLSNYDGYYLGDPRFDKLLSELNRRKAVVFIHPTTPPGFEASHLGFPEMMMDACFETTRTAYSLVLRGQVEKYPDVRFILAHAGGTVPYIAARVDLVSAFMQLTEAIPNGMEYYLKKFYYDTALSAAPYAFSSLQNLVETSHIVFGSDYIFSTAFSLGLTIDGVESYSGFNARDVAAIEYENALTLFPQRRDSQ